MRVRTNFAFPTASALPRAGIRSALAWTVAFVLVVGLVAAVRTQWQNLFILRDLFSAKLIAAGFCVLLSLTASALFAAEVYRPFGVRMPVWEWFCLGMASTLGNYITPLRGGAGVRAGYLWTRHGLGAQRFAVGMAGLAVVAVWVASTSAAIGLTAAYIQRGFLSLELWIIVGTCLVTGGALGLLRPRRIRPGRRWMTRFADVANGWHAIVHHPRSLARLVALAGLNRLADTFACLFVFHALRVPADFWSALTLTSLAMFAGLISITPGAIGIYEASVVLVGRAYGLAAAQTVMAALVIRLLALCWLAVLAPIGSAVLAAALRGSPGPGPASRGNPAHDDGPRVG